MSTTTQNSTDVDNSSEPSHIMTGDYVVLMETNGQEYESWYNFIRVEGNEKALARLAEQIAQVEWTIIEDLSTFDIDMEHKVSAVTAKQMCKLELNAQMFHRKFDGKLKTIEFGFDKLKKRKDKQRMNVDRICRVFDILGYGQIEDYISDQDLDPEDLETSSEEESSSSEEEESSSEEVEKKPVKNVNKKDLPKSLTGPVKSDLPGWAAAKKRK